MMSHSCPPPKDNGKGKGAKGPKKDAKGKGKRARSVPAVPHTDFDEWGEDTADTYYAGESQWWPEEADQEDWPANE